VLFVIGANIRTAAQGITLPSMLSTLQVLAITPLLLGIVASAGVLVSLRSPTVRQAQSRLMTAFMGLMIAVVAAMRFIPKDAVRTARDLSATQQLVIAAVWIAILAGANVVLFLAAWARFQRHRLIEIR
jgi:ABC-2 type transport system permease protein